MGHLIWLASPVQAGHDHSSARRLSMKPARRRWRMLADAGACWVTQHPGQWYHRLRSVPTLCSVDAELLIECLAALKVGLLADEQQGAVSVAVQATKSQPARMPHSTCACKDEAIDVQVYLCR
jgi:hypothetical protein